MPATPGQRDTQGQRHRGAGRGRSTLAAAVAVAGLVGGSFFASAASAQVGGAKPAKPAKATKVVKEVTRSPFGEILTNLKKHALYVETSGSCSGSCLVIWPPLLMPKGKTVPAGATGLGTVTTGSGLQVTYNSMPLYTFYTDTNKSVSGNDDGGFVVAQVTAPAS